MVDQIRAFVAIELPAEIRAALGELQHRLKSKKQPDVKWVDPDSIHLTLQFLGNILVESIPAISGAIAEAAQGIPPFSLEVKGLGAFPNLRSVRVVWVGIGGDVEYLNQLQKRVETNLVQFGFTPEARPFTAHLTLARVRIQATPEERQQLGQLLSNTGFSGGIIKVDAVNLMKSQLTRQGAIYSKVSSARLVKPLVNEKG